MNDLKENLKKDMNDLAWKIFFVLRSHQNMYRNWVALFQPPANNFLNLRKLST